jgi:hypothetical protein
MSETIRDDIGRDPEIVEAFKNQKRDEFQALVAKAFWGRIILYILVGLSLIFCILTQGLSLLGLFLILAGYCIYRALRLYQDQCDINTEKYLIEKNNLQKLK